MDSKEKENDVILSVRLPSSLHGLLRMDAEENDRSLNGQVIRILKQRYGLLSKPKVDSHTPSE